MERLMYDVYVAEATIENDYHTFDTPEKKEAYIREVFKKHRITQAEWDTSLSWYSDRIEIYLKMNDSVKARLQRAQREIDALVAVQHSQSQYDPRIFSISYIPTLFSFANQSTQSGFRFRLDSTEISTRLPEDNFEFNFSVIGLKQNQQSSLKSLLELEYKDTTIYRYSLITENRTYSLHASKYILDDTLKSVGGFVYLQDSLRNNRNIQLYNILLGNKKPPAVEEEQPEITHEMETEHQKEMESNEIQAQ